MDLNWALPTAFLGSMHSHSQAVGRDVRAALEASNRHSSGRNRRRSWPDSGYAQLCRRGGYEGEAAEPLKEVTAGYLRRSERHGASATSRRARALPRACLTPTAADTPQRQGCGGVGGVGIWPIIPPSAPNCPRSASDPLPLMWMKVSSLGSTVMITISLPWLLGNGRLQMSVED